MEVRPKNNQDFEQGLAEALQSSREIATTSQLTSED